MATWHVRGHEFESRLLVVITAHRTRVSFVRFHAEWLGFSLIVTVYNCGSTVGKVATKRPELDPRQGIRPFTMSKTELSSTLSPSYWQPESSVTNPSDHQPQETCKWVDVYKALCAVLQFYWNIYIRVDIKQLLLSKTRLMIYTCMWCYYLVFILISLISLCFTFISPYFWPHGNQEFDK